MKLQPKSVVVCLLAGVLLLVPATASVAAPTVELVSRTANSLGNDRSYAPELDADGTHLVFQSSATNLVPGDTNGQADVFVKDRRTGAISRVDTAVGGAQANRFAESATISGDGRYVAFSSPASNLVPGDTNAAFDVFTYTFPGADTDPYADAIGPGTNAVVLNGSNALGAPDGTLATVVGLLGGRIVLDLGDGEEGFGALTVHYGGLNVGVATTVDLLDASGAVVGSAPLRLVELGVGTHTAVVEHSGLPYRYVRINAGVLQVIGLDAVSTR